MGPLTTTTCLPPFEFSSGYTLKCTDLGDDGITIELYCDSEEPAAILLSPPQCEKFLAWHRLRIGRRVSSANDIGVSKERNLLCRPPIKRLAFLGKVFSDLEILYDIVKIDVGVTVDEIKNWTQKPAPLVFARDLLCFILRQRYDLPLTQIASILGARSHASPFLSLKKFNVDKIENGLYKQSSLTEIYKDAKRRYKKVFKKNKKRQNKY